MKKVNIHNGNDIKKLQTGAKLWSVDFIPNNIYRCPFCGKDLVFDDVSIAFFTNETDTVKNGLIDTKSLYCEKCHRHFIDENIKANIKKRIGKHMIKKNTPENNVTISCNTRYLGGIKRNLYKDSDEGNGSIETDYFDGLNTESKLHFLGYNVSKLSAEERWKILEYRVLPKMSIGEVISIINYNISLREGYSRFSSCVSAWKYDIKRLKDYAKNIAK